MTPVWELEVGLYKCAVLLRAGFREGTHLHLRLAGRAPHVLSLTASLRIDVRLRCLGLAAAQLC